MDPGSNVPPEGDGASGDRPPGLRPTFQGGFLVAASALLLVGVSGLIWTAYPSGNDHVPAGFWVPELVIVIVGGAATWIETILQWAAELWGWLKALGDEVGRTHQRRPRKKYERPGWIEKWVSVRDDWYRVLLIPCGIVVVIAVSWLVYRTGGGLKSPFAPLLTAMAIFGPFLARNARSVWAAVASVALSVLIVNNVGSPRPTPGKWAYTGVALVLLILAGFVNWLILRGGQDEGEEVTDG